MWLLSTDRAELHYFSSPEAVDGGYAILSHTWGEKEQTFQDTQDLRDRGERTGKNPRDLAREKVRECCILAERHGYKWIWNDTCCIDKTSSTELSEAINSMFLWYSCAEVCFAYLVDVESDCELDAEDSSFRTARWHSRGWTLQELIAPFLVLFVSRDWKIIGNKQELAPLLQWITHVEKEVLTREIHFSEVCVARRMLWAAKRSTSRVEDEAYSLMGLFNINMPPIYGEGQQAFQRLQREIMKRSFDTTLFARNCNDIIDLPWDCTPLDLDAHYREFNNNPLFEPQAYLLAESPRKFAHPAVDFWLLDRNLQYTPSATQPLQPYLDWQWQRNMVRRDRVGGTVTELTSYT